MAWSTSALRRLTSDRSGGRLACAKDAFAVRTVSCADITCAFAVPSCVMVCVSNAFAVATPTVAWPSCAPRTSVSSSATTVPVRILSPSCTRTRATRPPVCAPILVSTSPRRRPLAAILVMTLRLIGRMVSTFGGCILKMMPAVISPPATKDPIRIRELFPAMLAILPQAALG